jgi:nucleoside-diphosphate-sugar epimerase
VSAFVLASSTGVVFGGDDVAGGSEALPYPDEAALRKPAGRGVGGGGSPTYPPMPPPAGRYDGGRHFNDAYSESKARAERLVLAANDLRRGVGLATVALR